MNVVAFVLRAVQLARARGLTVTFEPGWETRGNGQTAAYVGMIEHHTATSSSLANPFPSRFMLRDGRSDLRGPLANSGGPADGSIHIVAAHPANHAGASGGRSMGPLPVTTTFNRFVWGHEIDYAGVVPMLPGQYRAAGIWTWCVLTALHEFGQISGFSVERARAHMETSITGKWDPGYASGKTIDMAAFRRAAAAGNVEDDMEFGDRFDRYPHPDEATRQPMTVGDYFRYTESALHGLYNLYFGEDPVVLERLAAIEAAQAEAKAAQARIESKVDNIVLGGIDLAALAAMVNDVMAKRLSE